MNQNGQFTIEDFTPEMEAKIPAYLQKYTEGIYDGSRYRSFDHKNAEALIFWNYEQSDYKKPTVIVAENPYEAQIYFNAIKANEEYYLPMFYLLYCIENDLSLDWLDETNIAIDGKLYDKLDDKLDDKLNGKLYGKLTGKLDDKLNGKLTGKLTGKLDGKLYGKLTGKLYDKLNGKLTGKLTGKLDDKLYDKELERFPDYLFTANIWSNAYAAHYKYIKDEFGIEIGGLGIMLDSWNDLYLQSGVYSAVFSELVCIVSKYPKKIHTDENDELHSVTGNAIEWGFETELTKFDCFYIHGRAIDECVYQKALHGKITQHDFINQTNDEVRSAWFEIIGSHKMMDILGADLVDSCQVVHHNGDIETIEYFRTKGNLNRYRNEPYAWRKIICPSTGTTYFTPTNPALKTALDVAKFHRPEWVPEEIDYLWFSRS